MNTKARYTILFKRMVVEEILSGYKISEIARRYNLHDVTIWRWKQYYESGKLNPYPTGEAKVNERIRQLEELVGRLMLDNEILKKALGQALGPQDESERLLADIGMSSVPSQEDVN